jgi:hypothetical protein
MIPERACVRWSSPGVVDVFRPRRVATGRSWLGNGVSERRWPPPSPCGLVSTSHWAERSDERGGPARPRRSGSLRSQPQRNEHLHRAEENAPLCRRLKLGKAPSEVSGEAVSKSTGCLGRLITRAVDALPSAVRPGQYPDDAVRPSAGSGCPAGMGRASLGGWSK